MRPQRSSTAATTSHRSTGWPASSSSVAARWAISSGGGLVNRMPVYAAVFMLFTLGNVGLPGTSGFPGEILTMVGAFQAAPWAAAGACLGVIFSAAYALTLYRKVSFGVIENPKLMGINDLDAREWITFAPLVVATLIMGLASTTVLDFTEHSARTIVAAFGGAP